MRKLFFFSIQALLLSGLLAQTAIPAEVKKEILAFLNTMNQSALTYKAEVAKVDVVGTFSAEATDRMGTGPTATEERTARASEETAKNTKKITQQLEESAGLAFA